MPSVSVFSRGAQDDVMVSGAERSVVDDDSGRQRQRDIFTESKNLEELKKRVESLRVDERDLTNQLNSKLNACMTYTSNFKSRNESLQQKREHNQKLMQEGMLLERAVLAMEERRAQLLTFISDTEKELKKATTHLEGVSVEERDIGTQTYAIRNQCEKLYRQKEEQARLLSITYQESVILDKTLEQAFSEYVQHMKYLAKMDVFNMGFAIVKKLSDLTLSINQQLLSLSHIQTLFDNSLVPLSIPPPSNNGGYAPVSHAVPSPELARSLSPDDIHERRVVGGNHLSANMHASGREFTTRGGEGFPPSSDEITHRFINANIFTEEQVSKCRRACQDVINAFSGMIDQINCSENVIISLRQSGLFELMNQVTASYRDYELRSDVYHKQTLPLYLKTNSRHHDNNNHSEPSPAAQKLQLSNLFHNGNVPKESVTIHRAEEGNSRHTTEQSFVLSVTVPTSGRPDQSSPHHSVVSSTPPITRNHHPPKGTDEYLPWQAENNTSNRDISDSHSISDYQSDLVRLEEMRHSNSSESAANSSSSSSYPCSSSTPSLHVNESPSSPSGSLMTAALPSSSSSYQTYYSHKSSTRKKHPLSHMTTLDPRPKTTNVAKCRLKPLPSQQQTIDIVCGSNSSSTRKNHTDLPFYLLLFLFISNAILLSLFVIDTHSP